VAAIYNSLADSKDTNVKLSTEHSLFQRNSLTNKRHPSVCYRTLAIAWYCLTF